jgi:glycosyltransferase involved in cell wall biosynthesis
MIAWHPISSRETSSSRLFVHNIHEGLLNLGIESKVFRRNEMNVDLDKTNIAIFQKWIDLELIKRYKEQGILVAIIPSEDRNFLNRYKRGELVGDWEKAFDLCDIILTPYKVIQEEFSKAKLFYEAEKKDDFLEVKKHEGKEKLTLVWIGWPGSSISIKAAEDGLKLLGERIKTVLYMICGVDNTFIVPQICPPVEIKIVPWGLDYPRLLLNGDIGILPKNQPSLSSANVAKTFMWAGIPMVASEIDPYKSLNEECKNKTDIIPINFASSPKEWCDQLLKLRNANIRKEIGAKLRILAEQEYDVEKEAKRLLFYVERLKG